MTASSQPRLVLCLALWIGALACIVPVAIVYLLEARDFTTGAITTNPLIVPNKNYDQGFEHFDHHREFRSSRRVIGDIRAWKIAR